MPAFGLLACSVAHYKLFACLLTCLVACLLACLHAYPSARLYLSIQLTCTLCAIRHAVEFTRDDAFSKRETSLTCVSAFTGLNCRLASLQPACLLARSLLLAGLHTHLFGCICRYSSLALSLMLHLPLSALVMMHSAKENRHLRGLCFSLLPRA